MNLRSLRARMQRLDDLGRGVARELVGWQKCDDPLLRAERLKYLDGMSRFYSGLEAARVCLAKVCRRLENERRRSGMNEPRRPGSPCRTIAPAAGRSACRAPRSGRRDRGRGRRAEEAQG
jgi:hypothetical protein